MPLEILSLSLAREVVGLVFSSTLHQGQAGPKGRDLGPGPPGWGREAMGPKGRISSHNLMFGTRHRQVRGAFSEARNFTVRIGKLRYTVEGVPAQGFGVE